MSVSLPALMKDAVHCLLKYRPHEKIPVQVERNDVTVLKEVVAQTDAVLFATGSSVRRDLEARRLAAVTFIKPPRLSLEFALVSLAERTPSPAASSALAIAGQIMTDCRRPTSARSCGEPCVTRRAQIRNGSDGQACGSGPYACAAAGNVA
jgi:hypothetical protein